MANSSLEEATATPQAMEVDNDVAGKEEIEDELLLKSRMYQLEMFEESLKRNIIVAMDTGTGKTRIAILRIRAELERSPPPKIVWFLAPTVPLCYQQFYAISSQIQCAQGRIIAGEIDIKAWSTQAVWDAALLNVRFVVATHQVLLEALMHGFVSMESIPLLVFDEVHGCVKNSPGRRIMTDFFHPAVENGLSHPAILGLTASPVQGKKLDGIELLESTMHATCMTPTLHRDNLVLHTKRPSTFRHICDPGYDNAHASNYGSNLSALSRLLHSPTGGPRLPEVSRVNDQFAGCISDGDIKWTWNFIKAFHRKADTISSYLGQWPAEYYVHKIIRRCTNASKMRLPGENEPYLMALLQHVVTKHPPRPDKDKHHTGYAGFYDGLSVRVQKLVEILANHEAELPTGIVFVREQPMAAVLSHIISIHPRISSRFKAGHVVGMSKFNLSRGLDGLLQMAPKDGRVPLLKFRNRELNLLVATSVIEEGIDMPACNLVVCIDDLTSLKSFIQRRGRARDDNSMFHLLMGPLKNSNEAKNPAAPKPGQLALEWESLEAEMKRMYEDEMREDEDRQQKDTLSALGDGRLEPIYVEATGARLLPRDAKQHLSHFCSTMSSAPFVDCRPMFKMHKVAFGEEEFRACVKLPITLPVHLRRAVSAFSWQSQSDAMADAAFQAYKAIYEAGLLTDNLLPPKAAEEISSRSVEGRPGVIAVREPYRPWPDIREMWKTIIASASVIEAPVYRHTVRIIDVRGNELFVADLILPCALPTIQPFQMYWTAHSGRPWMVHISDAQRQSYGPGKGQYHDDNDHAVNLLNAAFGHRWPLSDMHRLVRVVCDDEHFKKEHVASRAFDPLIFSDMKHPFSPSLACLVRDAENAPYYYQDFLPSKPSLNLIKKAYKGFEEAPEDAAFIVVRPWPKIVGMLHRTSNVVLDDDEDSPVERPSLVVSSIKPYPRVLRATECRVDSLPIAYVQLGALLPPLTPVLEVYLVAAELLSSTRLRRLAVKDISLVATAISAPVARLPTNYEYLEFIGDSILKVTATANCSAHHLYVPEGYLSLFKDRLVANSRLCRAALELGLDHFIVSKQWSLRTWKRYCDELGPELNSDDTNDTNTAANNSSSPKKQTPHLEMSTKMLADVVEALIGACHADNGMEKALQCIGLFLPEIEWLSLEECQKILFETAPDKPPCLPPPGLEDLLGYTFTKKSLLIQAITHASMPIDQEGACMERLEFIGDAILDHVIVQTLASVRPPLSHQRMHLLRTTLANAAFLAFTTMMFTIAEPVAAASINPFLTGPVETAPPFLKPLSAFMRHGASREMGIAQEVFSERFASKKDSILEQLWAGRTYPWEDLMGLGADKFYSDLLEAIIGAVWVDSGSLAAVETLLDAVGILPYLRRAVDENIHLLHPKEELGTMTGNAKIRYEVTRTTRAEAAFNIGCIQSSTSSPTTKTRKRPRSENAHDSDDDLDDNASSEGYSETSEEDVMDEADIRHNAVVGNHEDRIVFRCRLFFNGKCEFEANFCNTREEAETRAAGMALNAWKLGLLSKESGTK